jgi:hypothetical protein
MTGKKNNLARLASGFVILLANTEFYSHLASLRVIIRTPDVLTIKLCLSRWCDRDKNGYQL